MTKHNHHNKINYLIKLDENLLVVEDEGKVSSINFLDLIIAIRKSYIFIVFLTCIFAASSVFYALSLPNLYKSTSILTSSNTDDANSLASVASKFGGLASLAGINLGGTSNSTDLAVEVLQSRSFLGEFISEFDLKAIIMGVVEWNHENDSLVYNPSIYDPENDMWTREVTYPKEKEASLNEAYIYFREKFFNVKTDKEKGLVYLETIFYSPHLASEWNLRLIESINDRMKDRDLREAKRSIQFLQSQIEETNLTEVKSLLYQLLEEQTKTLMFANSKDEYVFEVIDPAITAEQKFKPRRALICIFGTLLGGVIAVGMVVIRFVYVRRTAV